MWHPVLAEVYGIRPWELEDLTVTEYRKIAEDMERKRNG